jgi:hypothetical protein
MIYRLGRHRRRNLYAQSEHKPSDRDVFVAMFDDPEMAKRVCRLLNADEQVDPPVLRPIGVRDFSGPAEVTLEQAREMARATERRVLYDGTPVPGPGDPLTPNSECICGHPWWMHNAGPGGRFCSAPEAADTCVAFQRRCEHRLPSNWGDRCRLVADHDLPHQSDRGHLFGSGR